MRPKKIDCVDVIPEVCGDLMCDLKVISRQEINVNVGCNLLKPFNKISFMGVIYTKHGASYKRFGPEFTGDYCDAIANRNNIVMNSIFKQLTARNVEILHNCPLFGPHYIKNLTVNEAFGLSVLPQGDYRIETRFADEKTNKTLLHVRLYFFVKAMDPLKDFKNVFDFKFS